MVLVSILKLGCKNIASSVSSIFVKFKLKSIIKNKGFIISSIIVKESFKEIDNGSGSYVFNSISCLGVKSFNKILIPTDSVFENFSKKSLK